jgi:hypothetical protein
MHRHHRESHTPTVQTIVARMLHADIAAKNINPRLTWAYASSRDWTRTNNLPVNSRLLCQLSYAGPPVGATPLG